MKCPRPRHDPKWRSRIICGSVEDEVRRAAARRLLTPRCVFGGMKPFISISLKVLLAAVIGVIIIHVWPLSRTVPVIVGLLWVSDCSLYSCLFCSRLEPSEAGLWSPCWQLYSGYWTAFPALIPAALVLGIIWLVRKLSHTPPASARCRLVILS